MSSQGSSHQTPAPGYAGPVICRIKSGRLLRFNSSHLYDFTNYPIFSALDVDFI
nr:MAG TPA: hypothetical protein [Bacteriophage sp.]